MLRKLAIAIAASGAMMSASATYALGMGDIVLDSALNQPLDARIKLLKASELEDWEIKPNLASREEFDKSGVERVFFLNSFRFEVERTDSGVFVNITSEQAVVEPYLNFLLQVDWPSGRLLREYTLLLDPPVFNEEPPQAVSAPQADVSDDYSEDTFDAPAESALPGMGVPSAPDEPAIDEKPAVEEQAVVEKAKTYAVRKNDTLWEVAIRTRDNRKISPQQAMLAIQDLNPNAFINGNINRLKKNQVLRVPTKEEMLSRSFSEAVSEVALQNQSVAKRKAQLDATRKDKAMERDTSAPNARLKLLAGGAATTDAKRGAGGKVLEKTAGDQSSLENDLNLALENLDKSNLENNELRTRLDSLEDQINTLQRLINLKDEQMVALQTGMSTKDAAEVVKKPVKKVVAPVADAKEQGDLNFAEPAGKQDVVVESESTAVEIAKAEKTAKPKPIVKPKKAYVPPVIEEEPFDVIGFAIDNPQIPGALLAALLGGLLLINRSRKRKEEEAVDGSEFNGEDPLDDVSADLGDDFESDFDDMDLSGDASESEFAESSFDGDDFAADDLDDFEGADSGLPDSLDGSDLGEGQDVLGEVDVYMAYNRVEPAKDLLEKTLELQPGRMELRVKLLEVLSEAGDQDAFDEQFNHVMENGSAEDQSQAERIKAGLASAESTDLSDDLGLGLDSSNDDFSLDLDSDSGGLDLDSGELDFDLDGLDLEADLAADLSSASDPVANNEFEGDSSLDFDMDLSDFESDSVEPVADVESTGNELSLDGGLEFDGGIDDLDDSLESLDLGGDDSTLDLGSLDEDNGLSFDTDFESSTEDALDLDVPSLTEIATDDNELEFESLDIPNLEASGEDLDLSDFDNDIEVPSLSEEVSLDTGDDLPDFTTDDGLDELSNLEEGSLESDLGELDLSDLDDSLDADLAGLSQTDDLDLSDDLGSLDADISELEESLDLSDVPDLTADLDSDLDALDMLSAGAEEFDGEIATETEDLAELNSLSSGDDASDNLESDEMSSLGELDLDNLDEDLDFLSGTDESETKLDLARAYIDMDDKDGAKEILQEVLEEGTDKQKEDASKLLDSMA